MPQTEEKRLMGIITPYFNIYGEIFPEEIDPPCYRDDCAHQMGLCQNDHHLAPNMEI
jgi:hypothetical protein